MLFIIIIYNMSLSDWIKVNGKVKQGRFVQVKNELGK